MSDDTRELVDAEVRRIVEGCHERGDGVLAEHRDQLESLTGALLKPETLDEAHAYRGGRLRARSVVRRRQRDGPQQRWRRHR